MLLNLLDGLSAMISLIRRQVAHLPYLVHCKCRIIIKRIKNNSKIHSSPRHTSTVMPPMRFTLATNVDSEDYDVGVRVFTILRVAMEGCLLFTVLWLDSWLWRRPESLHESHPITLPQLICPKSRPSWFLVRYWLSMFVTHRWDLLFIYVYLYIYVYNFFFPVNFCALNLPLSHFNAWTFSILAIGYTF